MTSINKLLYPSNPILYTRTPTGFTEQIESNYLTHRLTMTGQHSDTVRRIKPKDLWAGGTGWTYTVDRRNMLSTGRETISSNQYRVALPNRWWSGSGKYANTGHGIDLAGKLRARIKNQNVNLAQALGEYRQTADLFSRAASDVYQAFRSLRSGRFLRDIARYGKTPRNQVERDIANQWLRLQYGLFPLISDVYGSVLELNTKLFEGVWIYVNLEGQSERSGVEYWPSTGTPHGMSKWYVRHNLRLKARYKIADGGVKQLSQVGITNPLYLAWELLPYSFVVDWLFPVGNFLSSLDALTGTSNLSYYTIQLTRGRETGATYGGQFDNTFEFYDRNGPLTNVPLPRLAYKPSDSLEKVLNGLALLRKLR